MKYIICGQVLSETIEQRINETSPASGKYLRNIISALENNGFTTRVVTYLPFAGAEEIVKNDSSVRAHEFIFKGKNLIKTRIRYQRKIIKLAVAGDCVIFYNLSYIDWGLVNYLNRRKVKSILILADHTRYDEEKSISRKVFAYINEKEYQQFNNVIILSENSARYLKPKCNVLVMEGGINRDLYKDFVAPCQSEITRFMYAGLLSDVTGVDILLKAIEMFQGQNVEFIICGKGRLSNTVEEAASKDKRIHFIGYVSNDEYLHLLSKSNIVINPRNMDLDQNKNNFPSKVLEYLASGRPIISTKFPGYQRFEGNITFYDNKPELLAAEIEKACGFDNEIYNNVFKKNRYKAVEFDWNTQILRIINNF